MNKILKRIIILVMVCMNGTLTYGQCYKGDQKQQDPPTEQGDPDSGITKTLPIQRSSDPNEIIGTRGYDALGDTMQWVAATASLPYINYIINYLELSTAAAQKVEIYHLYYSIMNYNESYEKIN